MRRNKVVYLLIIAFFASIFIAGIIADGRHWKHASLLETGGQIGLGAGILLFLLVPGKKRD